VVSSNSRASASQVRFSSHCDSHSRKYSSADDDEELMNRIVEEVFTEEETNGDMSKAEQAEP